MPQQRLLSTMFMSEKEQFQYRDQAKKGNYREIPGAFRDTVFVPMSMSDTNPGVTRRKNQLRLEWHQRYIKKLKKQHGGHRLGYKNFNPTG